MMKWTAPTSLEQAEQNSHAVFLIWIFHDVGGIREHKVQQANGQAKR